MGLGQRSKRKVFGVRDHIWIVTEGSRTPTSTVESGTVTSEELGRTVRRVGAKDDGTV